MLVAFYAPLKPPSHPVASGDRTMARLLVAALERARCEVDIASVLRSRDGMGDAGRQARLRHIGSLLAERYVRRVERTKRIPELWFTYHLYDKAPDWIGPCVAERLAIPYVVAEASVAERRRDGPWQPGHVAVLDALSRADAVITLNSADHPALARYVSADRHHQLKPFIAAAPFAGAILTRQAQRARLATRYRLAPEAPWVATVAMMRPGDKLASYRHLAAALGGLRERPWQLLIIGDGPARREVTNAFAPCAERVAWLGLLEREQVAGILAACDLFAWPAINEAYGMAILEAQAAGLAVLAGASGGVADIVEDGVTGRLTPPGDGAAFSHALAELIAAPARCRELGAAAATRVGANHDIAAASARLDDILRRVIAERRRR